MDSIPLLIFCVASTVTPGPNNLMIMNSGLHFGAKRSMPHYLGICAGFPIMIFSVALGLGVVFVKYLWLKEVLKYVGAAYILYLAWQLLVSLAKPKGEISLKPIGFFQAVTFQWINPKAWMMAIGTISIFSHPESQLQDTFVISLSFLLTCIPGVALWLLCGTFLQKILKNEKQQRTFNVIMAIALVASIGMMFID